LLYLYLCVRINRKNTVHTNLFLFNTISDIISNDLSSFLLFPMDENRFISGHGRPDVRSSADGGEDEGSRAPRPRSGHARSLSVQSRSATRGPRATSVAPSQAKEVAKGRKQQDKKIFKYARAGDADREHYPKLVKHLNSGKRSLGTSTIGR